MANNFSYEKLNFHYIQNVDGTINIPNIYLVRRSLKKIGQIESISELNISVKFNEANTCSFKTYKWVDDHEQVLWDKIDDLAVILIEGFGYFQISTPRTDGNSTYKSISGTELFAVELGQTNISIEVNTDDDLDYSVLDTIDYDVPTLFYQPDKPKYSLLDRIINDKAPTFTIGHVDSSLCNMQRELSCENTAVYDFLTGDVAETFGCIFLLDPFERVINVYDLNDHCLDCGSHHVINGVCQECKSKNIEKGYGLDTTSYIDTENFAEEIQLSGEPDNVKNCFTIKGGDDVINDLIAQRLVSGTNTIWDISDYQLNMMSDELREKYLSYVSYIKGFETEYNQYWDNYNEATDQIYYWESSRMPTVGITSDTTPYAVWQEIKSHITYSCISSTGITLKQLSKNILNYAKLYLPTGYSLKYKVNTDGSDKVSCTTSNDIITSWTGYLFLYMEDSKKSDGTYEYSLDTGAWTLPIKKGYESSPTGNVFTNDYYLFLKQQINYKMMKLDTSDKPKYDSDYSDGVSSHLNDKDYYKNWFKEYGINRLTSFRDAYNQCTVMLHDMNDKVNLTDKSLSYLYRTSNGNVSSKTIYQELTEKYLAFVTCIEGYISEYSKKVENYELVKKVNQEQIERIRNLCNIENYLSRDLYIELLSFKREQVYTNSNFISDVDNDAILMQNIEDLIKAAKEQIAKAKEVNYTASVTIGNLLAGRDYNTYYSQFAIGNYIRLGIDDKIVKIRIVELEFNFSNIAKLPVTFSDALVGNSQRDDIQSVIESAKNMATTFTTTQKQSEKNDKGLNKFNQMFEKGLSEVYKMIQDEGHDQVFDIDESGILGRKWLEDQQMYDPCQLRVINNCIVFTKDNWQSIAEAIGKIYWDGKWYYGVIAEALIGRMIIGNSLEIMNNSGTYTISDDGFNITTLNGSINIDANNPSIVMKNSKNTVLDFNSKGDGKLTFGEDVVIGWNSITDGEKQVTTITKNELKTFKVTADNIEAGSISTNKLSTSNDGDMLTITGDHINIQSPNFTLNGKKFEATITGGSVAGWEINETGMYNTTAGYLSCVATGNTEFGMVGNYPLQTTINQGKIVCGYHNGDYSFPETQFYVDMCATGIYAQSSTGYGQGVKLLKVDTLNDVVEVVGTSSTSPAFKVKNVGEGTCLSVENTQSGYKNKAFQAKIYTGSNNTSYNITMFGEKETLQRCVLRCDSGDDTGNSDWKPGKGSLGTTNYPWENIYCTNDVQKSDLKLKNVIEQLDTDISLAFIRRLEPIKYTFKDGDGQRIHMGFGAQSVAKLAKDMDLGNLSLYEASVVDEHGMEYYYDETVPDEKLSWGLKYNEFEAPIIAAIQALANKIEKLENGLENKNG